MYNISFPSMYRDTENPSLAKAIVKASAEYLLDIFEENDTDVLLMVCMLAGCCMEGREGVAYLKIRWYCRAAGYPIPDYFEEMAADNDVFDYYCRELLFYIIILSKNMNIGD